MERLFRRIPEGRRSRVLFDLVVVQTALLVALAFFRPAGQNCALYGVVDLPGSFGGLIALSGPMANAHACLGKLREEALVAELGWRLFDDLYAVTYGAAGAFAFLWWRHAARHAHWPRVGVAALSMGAIVMAGAAIADLIENTAVMVALAWPDAGWAIAIARYAAAPKYSLALVAAPALALVALLIWRVACSAHDAGAE